MRNIKENILSICTRFDYVSIYGKISKLFYLIIISATYILTSCSNENNTTVEFDDTPTELEGTWDANCILDATIAANEVTTLNFTGNRYSRTETVYEDDNCEQAELSLEITAYFKIGDQVTIESGETVTKLDILINKFLLAPESAKLVSSYNDDPVVGGSLCGKSNWQRGVKLDVTNCDSVRRLFFVKDIFLVDGDTLKFGAGYTADENNEEYRPIKLRVANYSKLK